MIITDVTIPTSPVTEAIQARISHPEDLVWQQGGAGAIAALDGLQHISHNTNNLSVKWDGSPSLIFGRDPADGLLVVTDKSGFSAKRYDGLVKSKRALRTMLHDRRPNEPGRKKYAMQIASLWELFDAMVPANLTGFFQGDLMYIGIPDIVNGQYHIQPNKISYMVPADSTLGKQIDQSLAGIVVHGFIADRHSNVIPFNDTYILQNDPRFLVFSPDMATEPVITVPVPSAPNKKLIDTFLDPVQLRANKITDLGAQVGKFMAQMARNGTHSYANSATEFLNWIDTTANISEAKRLNITNYINNHIAGYNEMWAAISAIAEYKTRIKHQIDTTGGQQVTAYLGGNAGHEGYVATTPYGVIKLVDRHEFMRVK